MRLLGLCLAFCAALASTSSAQCPQASLDFGAGGLSHPPTDLLVFDDGSGPALYACGAFSAAGNAVVSGVARLDAAGWHAVGGGIDFSIYAFENTPTIYGVNPPRLLAALDDGSGTHLYAAGSASQPVPGTFVLPPYVTRWDGTQWSRIPGDLPRDFPSQEIYIVALATFDSGFGPWLYAGGSAYTQQDALVPYLARWDGVAWTRITSGPNLPPCDPWLDANCPITTAIESLTVFDDGTGPALWAGGSFIFVGTTLGKSLARFDGTTWTAPLGTSFTDGVTKLVVHDDGTGPALYVGSPTGLRRWTGSGLASMGFSRPVLDLESVSVAQGGALAGLWTVLQWYTNQPHTWRWDGAAWTETLGALDGNSHVQYATVYDDGSGPAVHVGGNFHTVDGVAATYVACHDVNGWSGLGAGNGWVAENGRPGRVVSLAAWNDGNGEALYAGGEIAWASGLPGASLARWNGSSWTPVPGLVSPTYGIVRALLAADLGQGSQLWMAGSILIGLQGSGSSVARLTPTGIVLVPTNLSGQGLDLAVFDSGAGPQMYATFGFDVGRYVGSAFQSIGAANSVGSGRINALCTFDDGTGPALYAGGKFTTLAGVPANSFARWNGQSWTAVPAGIGGSGDWAGIKVLRVLDVGTGPRLYAGGAFTIAGGATVSNLAVFDGQAWTDVGGGVAGPSAIVLDIAAFDDGRGDGRVLYVGGNFASAGGVPAHNLARFDGSTWSEVGTTGGLPSVRALQSVDVPALGGRALAVGGDFDSVAGAASVRFGLLNACDEIGATYCHGDVGACPCGNTSPAGARAGCTNSFGAAAALRASGTPSVAADTLVLDVTGMSPTPHAPTFFQGTLRVNGGAGSPFGDGLRCAGGAQVRIGAIPSSGGTAAFGATIPGTGSIALRGGILNAGVVRHYQVVYRNSQGFCTGATFNLSNGVSIQWAP